MKQIPNTTFPVISQMWEGRPILDKSSTRRALLGVIFRFSVPIPLGSSCYVIYGELNPCSQAHLQFVTFRSISFHFCVVFTKYQGYCDTFCNINCHGINIESSLIQMKPIKIEYRFFDSLSTQLSAISVSSRKNAIMTYPLFSLGSIQAG